MTVSLVKGGNVSLAKAADQAGLSQEVLNTVLAELGWDVRTTSGAAYDLDAQAMIVGVDNKVLSDKHFVFFGNKRSPGGEVELSGDNLTGVGEGADETITVGLSRLAAEADKVVILINIYNGTTLGQTFGQVRNAFVQIVASGKTLVRYDLGEDFATDVVVVAGELYRANGEWKFRAVGQGYDDLAKVARDYGVNV